MKRSALVVSVALTLAGSGAAAARPAHSPSPLTGRTTVSVFLRAPHPAALERLAARPVGTGAARAARLRELARLVPSAATHSRVTSALAAEGLSVVDSGTWSVTVTAPSAVVASRFGAATSTGELAAVPSAVAGLVSGVYLTSSGPAAFHHLTTHALNGTDIRRADTAAGVAPSTGTKDAGLTIATLQLANFKASDLTSYASSHGLADPVANGRYQAVTIDGGPPVHDTSGGDVEVALDQESILSTAPTATQHAYFAPNTNAGFADVFDKVYDDVVGSKAGSKPDPHLMALSVSWGSCETITGAHSIKVLEPIISSVVAAGVTIFSAAGDSGIYDCGSANGKGTDNHQSDVDYPASSPEVVSVGGSRLSAAASTANTGSNWTEKTWSCTGSQACAGKRGTGGGGGGVSGSAFHRHTGNLTGSFQGFPKPLYQANTLLSGVYAEVANRMTPDIVADGDPATGFDLTTSDPGFDAQAGGSHGVVGGTSLASPLSAAQLVNTLAEAGRRTGVGDIHGALYSAYFATRGQARSARTRAFRDVTTGVNGAAGDRGLDPSVSAAAGYDTTSGLGGVLWPAVLRYLLNTTAPTVTGSVTPGKGSVTITWTTAKGKDLMVPGATIVQVTQQGKKLPVATYTTASGTQRLTVAKGSKLTVTSPRGTSPGTSPRRRSPSWSADLDPCRIGFRRASSC